MYLSRGASRARVAEALNARKNRLEIVKALSLGQITKRDLFRWGLLTGSGLIAAKHGLSPFARSAYAAVPTATPPSPVPPGLKFTQPMPRANLMQRLPLKAQTYVDENTGATRNGYAFTDPTTGAAIKYRIARQSSYHTYMNKGFVNPVTGVGPLEGRPPATVNGLGKQVDWFAHQRWDEIPPQVGYVLSLGQIKSGSKFHPDIRMPEQNANSVWSFGPRYGVDLKSVASAGSDASKAQGYYGYRTGEPAPMLMQQRYGEPVLCRIFNDLPVDRELNGGFGRNEISTHYHNAHNGAESDGACNAYHFPGTFYDYHWSSMLARRDMVDKVSLMDKEFNPSDPRASTVDNNGKAVPIPGDFREIQGTMWFHDHRFFFTAENVHKGNFALSNMYSGPDRGNEEIKDGINLCLPSGIGSATGKAWGNLDYDVNLAITNQAYDQQGQLFFDIFGTDGFLGDILAVNGAYYPFFDVKARRYRFRILNASMSRFIQLAVVDESGKAVPFHCIANDGNLLPKPVQITNGILDQQGVAERFDIVVDFSIAATRKVKKFYLVNILQQTDGRKPDGPVSLGQAMAGVKNDPAVGKILEFRIGDAAPDLSADLFAKEWLAAGTSFLTKQIPVQVPVRQRTIEWVRSQGDSLKTVTGQCIPECGDIQNFPWSVKVNGKAAHSLNATRIGELIPKPGEVEHWTFINGGGGWDHPIHLHFEEGITLDRGGAPMADTEKLARKDVWRLRPSGRVKFQVRFGEFGGAYVNHCHNTVHEDFAMLLRYQLLGDPNRSDPQWQITPTPVPSPQGVTYLNSEVLPEGDPRLQTTASGGGSGKG